MFGLKRKGSFGEKTPIFEVIRGIILLPKFIKSLIINGPIDGAIMAVCNVDRADLNGPIEFLVVVFSKIGRKLMLPGSSSLKIGTGPFFSNISRKLNAVLFGPKAFLIL